MSGAGFSWAGWQPCSPWDFSQSQVSLDPGQLHDTPWESMITFWQIDENKEHKNVYGKIILDSRENSVTIVYIENKSI